MSRDGTPEEHVRQRVSVLAVGLLVVCSAALFAASPAAAATYPDADAACGETSGGQHLVGILPGSSSTTGTQVLTGSGENATLYAGTTLKLALCEERSALNTYGSEWELSNSEGLEILDSTDATATVRVTGETSHVDVLGLVDRKGEIPAVSIDVPRPATVDSELANDSITFESEDAKTDYTDNETRFLAAASNLTSAAEALNESAAAVESGEANLSNVTEEQLAAINDSSESVTEARADLEAGLYGTAWRASGGSNALAALEAAQERERSAKASADAAKRHYLATLEAAESDARSTGMVNLAGALVAGLVVGAVPGWKLTATRLERIRQDREVNSSVSYSPRVLAWAAGLAALAVVLTLAALFVLDGFGTLGELL
ncbi:hypothetical protein [Halorussus litoreus]|uniref:hypothetical protein n=1 Tax=Halorussus litoreus TaxID=1710536 RepID=UPI000E2649C3|nr:hypothetical protein [Halorussus litoreus]